MLTAALLLSLAAADGAPELPPSTWGFSARLVTLDGGTYLSDGPGAWLPEARLEAETRELAFYRVEVPVLEQTPPLFSKLTWVVIGLIASIVAAGVGLGLWELRGFVDGH